MIKKGALIIGLCMMLVGCSGGEQAEKSQAKSTQNEYGVKLMEDLNKATEALYNVYYMNQASKKVTNKDIDKNIEILDNAVSHYKELGEAPTEDLHKLYQLVGDSMDHIETFMDYAPEALKKHDPAFDDQYKQVEKQLSPLLVEINTLSEDLGM